MSQIFTSSMQLIVQENGEPGTTGALHCTIHDFIACSYETFELQHTDHSQKRSAQRGIGAEEIALTVAFGKSVRKQQLIFHIMGQKDIPDGINAQLQRKLSRLVVITKADGQELVTCYRNDKHNRHIRKKQKRNAIQL